MKVARRLPLSSVAPPCSCNTKQTILSTFLFLLPSTKNERIQMCRGSLKYIIQMSLNLINNPTVSILISHAKGVTEEATKMSCLRLRCCSLLTSFTAHHIIWFSPCDIVCASHEIEIGHTGLGRLSHGMATRSELPEPPYQRVYVIG